MCGRFGLTNPQALAERGLLGALRVEDVGEDVPEPLDARWNVAPSTRVLAALTHRQQGRARRRLEWLKWGFVPSWAKEPSIGNRLANARAEGIAEKPSFRTAWKQGRRCLIPADVFYEWQDLGDDAADPRNGDPGTTGRRPVATRAKPRKQPWAVAMQDGAPFAFGGLWEAWRDPAAAEDARPLVTCTIITTAPNALMATIHERMPVIVPREAYDAWLDRETPHDRAAALLAPYPAEAMRAWPISPWVNDPRHDDPRVVEPLA